MFEPTRVPSLTHTKLLHARFGGEDLGRAKWADLYRRAHQIAYSRTGGVQELRRISSANLVQGHKDDEGYRPLESTDVSLQGVDANGAFEVSFGIARKLGLPIEVTFEWRNKQDAQFPGERGTVRWEPDGAR